MQALRYALWLHHRTPQEPLCVEWHVICEGLTRPMVMTLPLIVYVNTLLFLVLAVQTLGRLSTGPYQTYQFPYTVTYLALRHRGPLLLILCLMFSL